MFDADALPALQNAIRDRTLADKKLLDELRDEVRPLASTVRTIKSRTITAVSLVASDGGNNKLQFDPFYVQLVRVVDSYGKQLCFDSVSPTTDTDLLSKAQFNEDGSPRTALGRLMLDLGVKTLNALSHMVPTGEKMKTTPHEVSPSWVLVYRDLCEWAVLYERICYHTFATDTLIVRDGLLRSKLFRGENFITMRRKIESAIERVSDRFKIVTHLSQPPDKKNIFVFTAERAVAYEHMPKIDFFVIDEFYKLDPGDRDDSRAVTLSQAFYKLSKGGAQFYLLGPNIDRVPQNVEGAYGCFFYQTGFGTVVSEQTRVRDEGDEMDRLVKLAAGLEEPTLIFCSSPPRVNTVARTFVERGLGVDVPAMQPCADWAGRTHHPDWVFCKAIVRGIGIHHGRLPRALAQYVVRAFNEGKLRYLICTSTLIEGVNTKAKNVIIFDNQIARQKIDYFTFNNIKGRSGRMGQHFIGHVYLFHEPPQQSLPFVDFPTLTQPKTTPTSLLIQMDEEDLKPASQKRVREYLDGTELPLSIVRQNAGIDPAHQVELARYIRANAQRLWPSLNWTSAPTSKQFRVTCELIWTYLVRADRRQYGVSSGAQLSFKTFQLMFNKSVAVRVREELKPGQYAAANPDEAVERVLEFDRNWAGFELPRLLMALSRIQEYVLEDEGLPYGDYASFAATDKKEHAGPAKQQDANSNNDDESDSPGGWGSDRGYVALILSSRFEDR